MTSDAAQPAWTRGELDQLAVMRELEISAPRADGIAGPWTPIWVVVADGEVFVRTWQRRTTGWYGRAVASGRARIRLAPDVIDVRVEAAGTARSDAVDAAYRAKYGAAGASSMVAVEAVASTLRLTPAR